MFVFFELCDFLTKKNTDTISDLAKISDKFANPGRLINFAKCYAR